MQGFWGGIFEGIRNVVIRKLFFQKIPPHPSFTLALSLPESSIKWIIVETLVRDHSNESYWAVLSSGAVYYAVHGGSNV